MYLINWNPEASTLEATFGGRITAGEASVFCDEIQEYLSRCSERDFAMVLDYATTSRLDDGVLDHLRSARDAGRAAGATKVSFIARSEQEALDLTEGRLQEVIDGREVYVAGRYAA